jgi:hypothetical protein
MEVLPNRVVMVPMRKRTWMRSIFEQFEPFAADRVFEIYKTGDVVAWVRQIREKSKRPPTLIH